MSTTVAREARSGAQLLPRPKSRREQQKVESITGWHAHLALDADLRRRAPEFAAIARHIIITPNGAHRA